MGVLGVVLEVVRGDDELTCSRAPNNDDDVIAVVFFAVVDSVVWGARGEGWRF